MIVCEQLSCNYLRTSVSESLVVVTWGDAECNACAPLACVEGTLIRAVHFVDAPTPGALPKMINFLMI